MIITLIKLFKSKLGINLENLLNVLSNLLIYAVYSDS